MSTTRIEKNGIRFSVPVYSYVPPPMKDDLDMLKKLDAKRFSNSQIVEDALALYVPQLKARLGLGFKTPTHGTPGKKSRRRRKPRG